jgi:nicotinamide riboside kinase
VQDGTRLDETERNKLSVYHQEQLRKKNIKYISIGGSWENRFTSMIDNINRHYFPAHA